VASATLVFAVVDIAAVVFGLADCTAAAERRFTPLPLRGCIARGVYRRYHEVLTVLGRPAYSGVRELQRVSKESW